MISSLQTPPQEEESAAVFGGTEEASKPCPQVQNQLRNRTQEMMESKDQLYFYKDLY